MSAMKYEMGRAATGAAAAGVVLVAGVVIREWGDKARAARASEEYLAHQRWAVDTAERDVPLQRRAQALLDDNYPLEETRQQLSSRRYELSNNDSHDAWAGLLARLASATINSATRKLGLDE